jgi:hypothetical protein
MILVIDTIISIKSTEPDYPFWHERERRRFVVKNLTHAQCERAINTGIPTLKSLIEHYSEYETEVVDEFYAVEDGCVFTDRPIILQYILGEWYLTETKFRNFGNVPCKDRISSSTTTYTMLPGGFGLNWNRVYRLSNGQIVKPCELEAI